LCEVIDFTAEGIGPGLLEARAGPGCLKLLSPAKRSPELEEKLEDYLCLGHATSLWSLTQIAEPSMNRRRQTRRVFLRLAFAKRKRTNGGDGGPRVHGAVVGTSSKGIARDPFRLTRRM
jgi:hypothetical protein